MAVYLSGHAEALIEYTTAEAMAQKFQAAREMMEHGLRNFRTGKEMMEEAFEDATWGFAPTIRFAGANYSLADKEIEALMYAYNLTAWHTIVSKIQLWQILSSRDYNELHRLLDAAKAKMTDEGAMPWLSAEAIQGILAGWAGSLDDLLARLIREEYEYWRPIRPRGYETDVFDRLGKKVIQTYAVGYIEYSHRFNVTASCTPHMHALDKAFHMLDGKGAPKGHRGPLVDAIDSLPADEDRGSTDYFRFRLFRNGNIHLYFLREDLLDVFNQVAAGSNLGQVRPKKGERYTGSRELAKAN